MDPTEDLLFDQAELFTRGELPLAGEAGEACQVVRVAPCPAHPVTGVNLSPTAGTLCTKPTIKKKETEELEYQLSAAKRYCSFKRFDRKGKNKQHSSDYFEKLAKLGSNNK